MIADLHSAPPNGRVTEYELRFCVLTKPSGRVEMRYFSNPRDADGVTIRLSAREREEMAFALATPGFHPIARDDSEDSQMRLAI